VEEAELSSNIVLLITKRRNSLIKTKKIRSCLMTRRIAFQVWALVYLIVKKREWVWQ